MHLIQDLQQISLYDACMFTTCAIIGRLGYCGFRRLFVLGGEFISLNTPRK